MYSPWEHLREALIRSLATSRSTEVFRQLRASGSVLSSFQSSGELREFLAIRSQQLDETDRIYAALVRVAQDGGPPAQVAYALLMCGLWPGLDRIYRRRVSRFSEGPDELSAAISAAFTLLVARIDLREVNRVAATLVRSTARDVTAALRRSRAYQARRVSDAREHPIEEPRLSSADDARPEDESGIGEINAAPKETAPVEFEHLPDPHVAGVSIRFELRHLHRTLHPIIGDDTELVLRVAVFGELRTRLAARTGVRPVTVRKRLERALSRLRVALDDR